MSNSTPIASKESIKPLSAINARMGTTLMNTTFVFKVLSMDANHIPTKKTARLAMMDSIWHKKKMVTNVSSGDVTLATATANALKKKINVAHVWTELSTTAPPRMPPPKSVPNALIRPVTTFYPLLNVMLRVASLTVLDAHLMPFASLTVATLSAEPFPTASKLSRIPMDLNARSARLDTT